MFVLLYNMQARMVGINQIQHTYKRKHPSCVLVLCGCLWCVFLCVKILRVLFSGENYCTIGTSIVHMLRFDGIGRKRIFLTNESICSLVWNLTSLAYKLRKSSVHVLLFNLVSGLQKNQTCTQVVGVYLGTCGFCTGCIQVVEKSNLYAGCMLSDNYLTSFQLNLLVIETHCWLLRIMPACACAAGSSQPNQKNGNTLATSIKFVQLLDHGQCPP